MRAWLLLGLVGCDTVYGLTERPDPDASVDADDPNDGGDLADAGPGCPGTTPAFTPTAVFLFPACTDFTTSAATNRGLMTCGDVLSETSLTSGTMTAAVANVQPGQTLLDPRLSSAGDEMFVTSKDSVDSSRSIRIYRRTGGQWHHDASPSSLPTESDGSNPLFTSPPTTMLPGGRRVIIHRTKVSVAYFSEYLESSGVWTGVHDYTAADLGVATFAFPSLSPDGLQLVFSANPIGGGPVEVRYAKRVNVTTMFDSSVKIDVGADNTLYPHLAPDCTRLYFTALSTVQYVQP